MIHDFHKNIVKSDYSLMRLIRFLCAQNVNFIQGWIYNLLITVFSSFCFFVQWQGSDILYNWHFQGKNDLGHKKITNYILLSLSHFTKTQFRLSLHFNYNVPGSSRNISKQDKPELNFAKMNLLQINSSDRH